MSADDWTLFLRKGDIEGLKKKMEGQFVVIPDSFYFVADQTILFSSEDKDLDIKKPWGDLNRNAICEAAFFNQFEMIKWLVEQGALPS